jgi:hypothetical protein
MVGNYNTKLVCCFSGETVSSNEAVFINVFPSVEKDEGQKLFSHKKCFVKTIHKSIILHPDFFDDEGEK